MPTIEEKLGPVLTPQVRKTLIDNLRFSLASGIVALGSTQAQAASSLFDIVVVTSATSATQDAFKLRDPSLANGYEKQQFVINRAAAQVRVWCPTGGIMNGVTNGSVTLASAAHGQFICINPTTKEYVKV